MDDATAGKGEDPLIVREVYEDRRGHGNEMRAATFEDIISVNFIQKK